MGNEFIVEKGTNESVPREVIDEKKFETPTKHTDEAPVPNIVDLPSNGRMDYPAVIQYRDMLFKDEKTLASASDDTYVRTLNSVLKSILNDCEFYEDLSIHDRDYLLMWVFANNFSSKKELEIQCRSCKNIDNVTVDLTELKVVPLSDEYVEPFEITTEKGHEITIRGLKVKDELFAEKYIRNQLEDQKNPDDIIDVMVSLSIDPKKEMRLEDKLQWVEDNLTVRDMKLVRHFHEYFSFGPDDIITHECTKCAAEVRGRVPFRIEEYLQSSVSDDFGDILQRNARVQTKSK